MIFDLHTHTVLSDGTLIPAESVRSAKVAGYSGIAITDHADRSNLEGIITSLLRFKSEYNDTDSDFKVLAGVELTHVRPSQIALLTAESRQLGVDIVIVHGETITESVEQGTNLAAINAKVDILAHPGLITDEETKLAADNRVYLEITARKGHAYTNGHVACSAFKNGAKLVLNTDSHGSENYVGYDMSMAILMGASLSKTDAQQVIDNTSGLFKKLFRG
jgi:histidinol phosphatase-like PHP family hydrolase